jgi:hydroxypyruvate isomerase
MLLPLVREDSKMPKFASSLNLMFTEWPLLDRFAAARDAGFLAVEVQFPYDETPDAIAAKLAASGLELVLINTPRGPAESGGRGLAALRGWEAEFRAAFDRALQYADATGARMIHVMAGNGPDAERATFEASLRWAADRIGGRPVTAMLEPLNLADNPGYFLCDFNLAASIIRKLDLPTVRLQYDIYHRQMLHGDIVAGLREMLPITAHVQFAGVPGRNEPDGCEIDYGYVLGEIDRLGYRGWVGAEYKPRAGTLDGLGWMKRWGA